MIYRLLRKTVHMPNCPCTVKTKYDESNSLIVLSVLLLSVVPLFVIEKNKELHDIIAPSCRAL